MKRVQAQLEELKHYNNGELHQYQHLLIVTLQKIFIQIIEKSTSSDRILFKTKTFKFSQESATIY